MNPGYKSSEFPNEIFSAKAQEEVQSESMKIIFAQSSVGKPGNPSRIEMPWMVFTSFLCHMMFHGINVDSVEIFPDHSVHFFLFS